jgi:hypothetical protein
LQAVSSTDAEENAVQLSPLFSSTARAPQPVWRGSVAAPVKFSPTPRKLVAGWYRLVRAWKRVLKGILWRAVDRVYEALISFLNYTTGQLDPSIDAIAERSGYSPRHVVTALAVLRELRVIVRIRRCDEYRDGSGRHHLRQIRNAYQLLPPSQWLGFTDPSPPPPEPGTWGDHPPSLSALEEAAAAIVQGHADAALAALENEHLDPLTRALTELGRLVNSRSFTGLQRLPRNPVVSSSKKEPASIVGFFIPPDTS